MSIPGAANPLLLRTAAAGGYQISRSLRFNSSDSAYLSRAVSTTGNRKTFTFACWIKLSSLSALNQYIFTTSPSNATDAGYFYYTSNQFVYWDRRQSTDQRILTTNAVYRDPSAWYHVVLSVNYSASTSTDRAKIYVNGVEQSYSAAAYPSTTESSYFNAATTHYISAPNGYVDAYLADVFFIDGQALDPSSFVETSATTGQLIPKAYTGSFGTNGFWLKFSDNSAATATTLGKDYSGNGNNWTPNNLSVTAGAGNDSLVDTPTSAGTDTGLGGQVTGNYCTFNPIARSGITNATLANGNLDISGTGGGYTGCLSTFAVNSGKWYYEFTVTNAPNSSTGGGIVSADSINQANGGNAGFGDCSGGYLRIGGVVYNNGSAIATGLSSIGTNDVLNVAFDLDAGKIWFGKNGTWDSSGNPAAGTGAVATFTPGGRSFYIFAQGFYSSGTWSGSLNTGARNFAYTAPSGFKALCDTNLPAPVVAKSSDYFQTVLYTGNGSTQTISGLGFSPDFVWVKKRNTAANHYLADTVRGATKALLSDVTDAEYTSANYITAFNSDGFSVGSDSGYNTSSHTYVAWAWDAGSSTVTNTQGSITTSVRASASSGFAVITGSTPSSNVNFSFGHNLGIAPSLVIYKHTAVSGNWQVYHRNGGGNNYNLNSTAGPANSGTWSGLDPTSTLITIPSTIVSANSSAFVCYAWAPVAGYSSFGSYVAGSNPFVYLGFRPRFILFKNTSVSNWDIYDSSRTPYNESNLTLAPNLSGSEYNAGSYGIDLLSNGFKLDDGQNTAGATFVYAAFAESPFQYARAR